MTKNVLVSAGVALLVVVLGLSFFGRPSIQVIKETIEKIGAIPGSDIPGPVAKINGSPIIGLSQRFNTGTTTVCSFDVRPYASSTIISLGGTVLGVPTTTTGSLWRWFKALTPSATTTVLTDGTVITATGTTIFASTTIGASNTRTLQTGDNYLVFDFQGGSVPFVAVNSQTGICSAVLHSPNSN